ncbi:protein-disulfide isomerase [Agromyces cerinus]|uniref:DsbA family protein n=1 Tax=Agromyces cerinus TaxID=33878 RepID=UPI0019595881|nr:thioredoxin domain-containing protein [Agromyces cerinus]MBM7831706.1 protein-disulfide isomerase [Agromyces cerinus]
MSTKAPAPKPVHPLARKLRFARILNVVLGAVAAFLLVVVIALSVPSAGQAPAAGAPQTPSADAAGEGAGGSGSDSEIATRDPDDPLAIGDVDAPVVLVEWADFRCPFCAVVTNETLPTIFEEYVDKGLVRYEFRDVAFFGEESIDAAVAARAAGEQGKFPEYLEAVFAAAPEKGHPDMPREKLIGFATEAGVPDLAKFEQDLDRADLRDAVLASTAEAQKLGVTSVPFFVAGDQAIAGAQPIENFRALIDEQLAAAGE